MPKIAEIIIELEGEIGYKDEEIKGRVGSCKHRKYTYKFKEYNVIEEEENCHGGLTLWGAY